MKKAIERALLVAVALASLVSASCGVYQGEMYVGYGYTGGNYYEDVFYTPPYERAGFYGYPY